MFKRNTNRLTKLRLEKILLDRSIVDLEDSGYDKVEEEKEREILFNIILPNMEDQLDGNKSFLCGYDFSIADIAFFNELTNILTVLEMDLDSKKYPNTVRWMARIDDIGPIRLNTLKLHEEWRKLQDKLR